MKLLPIFERLLAGWRERDDDLVATRDIASNVNLEALPRCNVEWRELPGRSGVLAAQGAEFLAAENKVR